ncbi:TPA: hypothetical protein ACSP3M_003833 [Aeromonas veronii]
MSGYPDHGVGADDPGLGMLALFVCLHCVWVSSIKQDGVERTINAVNGIVMGVIGRFVLGALKVVTKATETLADLDGGSLQQGLFKMLGIGLVIIALVTAFSSNVSASSLQAAASLWRSFSRVSSRE